MSYNIYDPVTKQLKRIAGNAGDLSAFQPKILASTLTIGGQPVSEVEPALGALNTEIESLKTFIENYVVENSSSPNTGG